MWGGSCKASMLIFMSCSRLESPSGLYCLAMFSDAIRMYLGGLAVGVMGIWCGVLVQGWVFTQVPSSVLVFSVGVLVFCVVVVVFCGVMFFRVYVVCVCMVVSRCVYMLSELAGCCVCVCVFCMG